MSRTFVSPAPDGFTAQVQDCSFALLCLALLCFLGRLTGAEPIFSSCTFRCLSYGWCRCVGHGKPSPWRFGVCIYSISSSQSSRVPNRKVVYGLWLTTGIFVIVASLLRCVLSIRNAAEVDVSTIWAIRETVRARIRVPDESWAKRFHSALTCMHASLSASYP